MSSDRSTSSLITDLAQKTFQSAPILQQIEDVAQNFKAFLEEFDKTFPSNKEVKELKQAKAKQSQTPSQIALAKLEQLQHSYESKVPPLENSIRSYTLTPKDFTLLAKLAIIPNHLKTVISSLKDFPEFPFKIKCINALQKTLESLDESDFDSSRKAAINKILQKESHSITLAELNSCFEKFKNCSAPDKCTKQLKNALIAELKDPYPDSILHTYLRITDNVYTFSSFSININAGVETKLENLKKALTELNNISKPDNSLLNDLKSLLDKLAQAKRDAIAEEEKRKAQLAEKFRQQEAAEEAKRQAAELAKQQQSASESKTQAHATSDNNKPMQQQQGITLFPTTTIAKASLKPLEKASEIKETKDNKNIPNKYYQAFEHFKGTRKKRSNTPKTQRALLCACAAILTKSLTRDQEQAARNYIITIKEQQISKSQKLFGSSLKTHRLLATSLSDFLDEATKLNQRIEAPLTFIYAQLSRDKKLNKLTKKAYNNNEDTTYKTLVDGETEIQDLPGPSSPNNGHR